MATKKEKILETAMKLFVEKGIQSTPTSLIAKEAGVATGTLFHHFKTKEDLVHELYHSIFDSILDFQKERIDESLPPLEKLRQIWHLDIEWSVAHAEYVHFLERYSFFYYATEAAINEFFERFSHCIENFKEIMDNNLMKNIDFEYAQDHYIWNIRMNSIYFIKHPESCTPENIEQSFNIYWAGIKNDQH
jgi:AcrR family transcriptional regulator